MTQIKQRIFAKILDTFTLKIKYDTIQHTYQTTHKPWQIIGYPLTVQKLKKIDECFKKLKRDK